ncbi:VWA domain-containing protein [Bacillus xiapuensis]|uniref:VWA domain-containing protein n=1 Tax=Bacillus xiapuensis TaxID=2014075 RepID=UPI000C23493E|nr:VWA domain-containing protein [Bacillus xiapuensis]
MNTFCNFKSILVFLLIFSFVQYIPLPVKGEAASNHPASFSVRPSADEVAITAGGARSSLNVDISNSLGGQGIDVAFVQETSKWMHQKVNQQRKSEAAKAAVLDGVDYFTQNGHKQDRFYFVPFDSEVSHKGKVRPAEGLENIRKAVSEVEEYSSGGNNYQAGINQARSFLNNGSNNAKYIIFLSDGNSKGRSNKESALALARQLKEENIIVYSIALHNSSSHSSHSRFLEELSSQTGGQVFRPDDPGIYKEITADRGAGVKGEVIIDLDEVTLNGSPAGRNVLREDSESRQFSLSFDTEHERYSSVLPLLFKKEGAYTFHQMKLKVNGNVLQTHPPVTITVKEGAPSDIGVDFSAAPSAAEYVKPIDDLAKGRLDFEIKPTGMARNEVRKPIDVVFVHDTSGSMKEDFGRMKKETSAKNALKNALQFFEANQMPEDRYYFVPFDSYVSDKKDWWGREVKPAQGLANIRAIADNLDYFSEGGTNYSQSLEYAMSQLTRLRDSNKYIVFLTDGEPTSLTYKGRRYEIMLDYYRNKIGYVNGWQQWNYRPVEEIIHREARKTADLLGQSGITMYSIAFAKEGEVNYQLLDEMSRKTGGYAVEAQPDTISNVFADIAKKFDNPAVSGEIAVDLKPFGGKVQVAEGADAYVDDKNVAHIKFNFTYPPNKAPIPQLIQSSLPLTFAEKGTYTFNDIELTYQDLQGKMQSIVHKPIKVEIKDETAPIFDNIVEITGNSMYSADHLWKKGNKNGESNQFAVRYQLNPINETTEQAAGELSRIKIDQPLPDGIRLADNAMNPREGTVKEIIKDGKRFAEITINQVFSYRGETFVPKGTDVQVKLQADYAIGYVTMPRADIHYYDSRFKARSHALTTSSKRISMRVMLEDSHGKYIGDYTGKIQKINPSSGEVLAETTYPNDDGLLNKPVKGMEFAKGDKQIKITYYDDSTAILKMQTDFVVKERKSGRVIEDGGQASGSVTFQVSDIVAGDDVQYEYRIVHQNGATEWKVFDPKEEVAVPDSYTGKMDIHVRTAGGFTLSEEPVKKTVEIKKEVEEIQVMPNPIEVLEGESTAFTVTVLPQDAADKRWEASIKDASVAALVDHNRILGESAGKTEMIITSKANPKVRITVPIVVKSPFVELDGLSFKQPQYDYTDQNEWVEIKDLIELTPEDATNVIIDSVTATKPGVVQIGRNAKGEWLIKNAKNRTGATTVTVIAKQHDKDNQPIAGSEKRDSAVFEVKQKSGAETPGSGSDDGEIDESKW